jgi:hypothetical protein
MMLLVKKKDKKGGGRYTMNSCDNIQYNKNHNCVKFDQKRSNLPAFFLAVVAAFIINDVTLPWKMLCFFCDFLKLETPSSTQKKIFFDVLQENIFSDTIARKDLLCHWEKRSFMSVTYEVMNSYVNRIQLLKLGKTQLQLSYTTNISSSILPYHCSHKTW